MAQELNGVVVSSDKREFGHANIRMAEASILFEGVNLTEDSLDVWMSHGDKVEQLPSNFSTIAHLIIVQLLVFRMNGSHGLDYSFTQK